MVLLSAINGSLPMLDGPWETCISLWGTFRELWWNYGGLQEQLFLTIWPKSNVRRFSQQRLQWNWSRQLDGKNMIHCATQVTLPMFKTFPQIRRLSRYWCLHLGSLHPRILVPTFPDWSKNLDQENKMSSLLALDGSIV